MMELFPGVAISKILSEKYSFNLISKAGGFGSKSTVSDVIAKLITGNEK